MTERDYREWLRPLLDELRDLDAEMARITARRALIETELRRCRRCRQCGQPFVRQTKLGPSERWGRTTRYCPDCRAERKREAARLRMQRLRQRRKEGMTPGGPPLCCSYQPGRQGSENSIPAP